MATPFFSATVHSAKAYSLAPPLAIWGKYISESHPTSEGFFFFLNLLWNMNGDFHFEVPKLNISSCIQFVHNNNNNNKYFVWFLGEDQAKWTRSLKNIHIPVFPPPPKILYVSFCSFFFFFFTLFHLFLFYFINYYLCLSQYWRTKHTSLTTGLQWGLC